MMRDIRIGDFILNYRKEHALTQEEFGKLLSVSAVAVSKWERRICYPDIFLLADLSEILGISIDDMLRNVPKEACH
ncbi:MAG: helix-turn-helix transcriptional regulator [Clostridia bacterium]|nr:helix-turn-helix transcriptional regulator [Clostridia bacterium]